MTTITTLDITRLPVDKLDRHPSNRPLGLNLEKIEQIKASMSQYGFYSNQPIVVRPVANHYQIIKGEHRFIAAQELGFVEVPCSVQEMTDAEALVQLIIGNIQSENKPLEIGLNAMEFISAYGKDGESARDYSDKASVNYKSLSRYVKAAKVYIHLSQNVLNVENILQEDAKLAEIEKCTQSDWKWLHDFIATNDLSTINTIAVCKAVRDLDESIAPAYLAGLFDGLTLKQRTAQEVLTADKSKTLSNTRALSDAIQAAYSKLDSTAILYTYNIETDTIEQHEVELQSEFISTLKTQKRLDAQIVNKIAIDIIDKKQRFSIEAAENTRQYYKATKNHEEAQSRIAMDRELDASLFDNWMACQDEQAIATANNVSIHRVKITVANTKAMAGSLSTFTELAKDKDGNNITDGEGDVVAGFDIPIYNIWTFAKKTNEVTHFGNSEQRIVENLVYACTSPFDIVFDPFAGGGATIDVCRKRFRRYWISDRKPTTLRERDIRQHDLVSSSGTVILPDLHNLWSEVTLTYLDPPYWRQAAGQYSDDATDLANMPLDQFTATMAAIVNSIANSQARGYIALIIQPTQWSADNRQFTDHVTDIDRAVNKDRLVIDNRVSVPYSTEQYNAQQVEWSKANKKFLVLTRELIIWRII